MSRKKVITIDYDNDAVIKHPINSLRFNLYGFSNLLHQFLTSIYGTKLHHSIIISGPRGVGKTALALRIAYINSVLLNQNDFLNKDPEKMLELLQKPLNSSDNLSRQFLGLSHPDFMFISPDFEINSMQYKKTENSIISIDEVRSAKIFLNMTTAISGYKVLVIEDAHKMNISAANALLKVLEEPTQNTFIIMTTSNIFHLPITIRSRCNIVKIAALNLEDFKNAVLQNIAVHNIKRCSDIEFIQLYKITHGNIRLASYLLEHGVEHIHKFIDKLLSGNVNSADFADIKKNIDDDNHYFDILIFLLKDRINTKLKNNLMNSNFDYTKMHKYIENFAKIREVLDGTKKFHLDKIKVLVSMLGVH